MAPVSRKVAAYASTPSSAPLLTAAPTITVHGPPMSPNRTTRWVKQLEPWLADANLPSHTTNR